MEVKTINGYSIKDETARQNAQNNKNSIDNINNTMNDKLKVSFLSIGNNPVTESDDRHLGDCIVITGKKNIILDLGFQDDCEHLIEFLNNNNINKIDYIILSHYHLDHVGGDNASGLSALLDSDIDFTNCVVYLPHKNIDWNSFTGLTFSSIETSVKNLLNSNNIEYIEPENEDTLTIDDNLKLTFYNIGEEFYNDYYDDFVDWNLNVLDHTIYNNFSMVVLLEHFKNKFLFTGDIYSTAQSNIYPYIKDIDVLKVEHHGLNYDSNVNYLNQLNPKYAVVGELDPLNAQSLIHNTLYSLKEKGCSIYRTTISGDVTITSSYEKLNANALEKFDIDTVNHGLYEGELIPTGSDLNDYLTPGVYNSNNQTKTATLLNCPITNAGFKLIVERHTQSLNSIRQTLLKNNVDGKIYVRNKIGNDFGKWKEIGMSNLNFTLNSTNFTLGNYDITFNTDNHECEFECVNGVANLSVSFTANEEITSSTDIFILPETITLNGESITMDYLNKVRNIVMVTNSGDVYPCYLAGGRRFRARKNIPSGATIKGCVTWMLVNN